MFEVIAVWIERQTSLISFSGFLVIFQQYASLTRRARQSEGEREKERERERQLAVHFSSKRKSLESLEKPVVMESWGFGSSLDIKSSSQKQNDTARKIKDDVEKTVDEALGIEAKAKKQGEEGVKSRRRGKGSRA